MIQLTYKLLENRDFGCDCTQSRPILAQEYFLKPLLVHDLHSKYFLSDLVHALCDLSELASSNSFEQNVLIDDLLSINLRRYCTNGCHTAAF